MKAKTPEAVVRWLNLLRAIREAAPFSALTADEEVLLEELVLRWHQASAVSVSDVMYDGTGSSPSTIYRRLVGLRDKGLVQFRTDTTDKRIKFVQPTSAAADYVQRLGKALNGLGGTES